MSLRNLIATDLKASAGHSLTQIKSESFLEDINNILNAGDVPNIYVFDDLEQIYTAMKPIVQDLG
jgi:dynein heavy chain